MESGLSLQTRRELLKPRDPTVSGGNDGQEEEQTVGCRDTQRPAIIASTPCISSTIQKRCNPSLSTRADTITDQKCNTPCSWSGTLQTGSRAKCLMPFLPTLVEALERHEHLHLTEECRNQLLSMSAATADRLLRSQRTRGQRGLSTPRSGTLLKQQIPVRTCQEWNEDRPGLSSGGPGRPLWYRNRRWLPVHGSRSGT